MSNHSPIRYHHYLLLSTPASALAGMGLGAALRQAGSRRRHLISGTSTLLLLLGAILYSHPTRIQDLIEPRGSMSTSKARAVEAALAPYIEHVDSMMTSRQFYAFRLGVATPPNLAVTSLK